MFVSKKYHEMRIKSLEDCISTLRDSHLREISAFKSQIADLRALVFPAAPQALAPTIMEADSVIEGNEKPHQVSDEDYQRIFNESREASLLLSGDYSDGFIQ